MGSSASRNDFRDDFAGSALDTSRWTTIFKNAGAVVASNGMGVTVTSSELRITSGTTANVECIVRSTKSFPLPAILDVLAKVSGLSVNVAMFIELVDSIDQSNFARWSLDGDVSTTTTSAQSLVGNDSGNGNAANHASLSAVTSLVRFIIDAYREEVWFQQGAIESNAALAEPISREHRAPDPTREYFIQFRVKNGAAPAANRTFTIDRAYLLEYNETFASMRMGPGTASPGRALAATIAAASVGVPSLSYYPTRVSVGATSASASKTLSADSESVLQGKGCTLARATVKPRTKVTGSLLRLFQSDDNVNWTEAKAAVDCTTGSRTIADGSTTSASPTLQSVAQAAFSQSDVGKIVRHANIPEGTYIKTVESTTSCTMSANATATGGPALSIEIGADSTYYIEDKIWMRYVKAQFDNGSGGAQGTDTLNNCLTLKLLQASGA